jgi:hypothetical protein
MYLVSRLILKNSTGNIAMNLKHGEETNAKESKYELVDDSEGVETFRGHLVVACSGSDQDLELAKKIALYMDEEFDATKSRYFIIHLP